MSTATRTPEGPAVATPAPGPGERRTGRTGVRTDWASVASELRWISPLALIVVWQLFSVAGVLPDPRAPGLALRTVAGGFLAQSRDAASVDDLDLRVVTRRAPSEAELAINPRARSARLRSAIRTDAPYHPRKAA